MIRSFPFAYLLAGVSVAQIQPTRLEAAAIEGVRPWQRWVYVVLPSVGMSVACGWLLVLALAYGDVSASILALPPGVTTLAVRIFGLVHYGVEDQLAAVCLSTAISLALLALLLARLIPCPR